jgi:hypothetical protein
MNRAAQCARLTAFYPSASPGPDRAYYDLGLKLSSQSPAAVLTLRTELPPDFPQVPPILRFVNPNVAHPWLDAQGRVVGLHDLYNWDWRVSDLGDVVRALTVPAAAGLTDCRFPASADGAMTEFTLHPPRLSQPAPPPPLPARPSNSAPPPSYSSSRSSPPSGPASGAQQQQQRQQQQQHADQVQVPPIPSDFPELQRLNMAQLQALLDSETTFMSLFNSLSVVSNVNDIRQAMQTNNVALATRNVESQAPVEEAKARIQSLGEQLRRSRGEFEVGVSSRPRWVRGFGRADDAPRRRRWPKSTWW